MTVIDIFVDRPSVVPKQTLTLGNRKQKPEGQFMPEIQGCIAGNVLEGDSSNLYSMDANKCCATNATVDAQLIKEKEESTGSSLLYKKQKILVKTNRTPIRSRRKSRWKLKFHHQALPPEYLRHYKQQEKKRRQTETNKNSPIKNKSKKGLKKNASEKNMSEKNQKNGDLEVTAFNIENLVKKEENTLTDTAKLSNLDTSSSSASGETSKPILEENVPASHPKLRCRSTDELFNAGLTSIPHLDFDVSQNKAFLENLLTNQIEINKVEQKDRKVTDVKNSLTQFNKLKNIKHDDRHKPFSIPSSGRIMNYSDLPYMGEITLDGIKPRRGRKPKKADICHLIYKNYGQVFPGAPSKKVEDNQSKKPGKWRAGEANNSSQRTKRSAGSNQDQRLESPLPTVSSLIKHTEVQNRIINSLLEKRLTQGVRMKHNTLRSGEEQKPLEGNEEPLNLCLRDLQSLKIKLSRKHGNFYETKQKDSDELKIKMEVDEGVKAEEVSIDKSDSEFESTDDNEEEDDLAPFNLVTTELRESSDDDTFLNFNDQITLTRVKASPKKIDAKDGNCEDKVSSLDIPMGMQNPKPLLFWPGGFFPAVPPSSFMCCPKIPGDVTSFNIPAKAESSSQEKKISRSKNEGRRIQLKKMPPNGNTTKAAHVITKRKRSAIFIPPVPAESTMNPTTEVSICKFKFTGGAKPSLQEKKMLSVDSGGNFRYYSGTGDKSMRGYEYFPRESLQQCQENTGCSPSGVFLTASALGSGEKIPEEIGHSGFFDRDFPLHVPASKTLESKLRAKSKKYEPQKRLPDASCYETLREHLLGSKSEPADLSIIPDDLERDDGNLSDQSGDGFDLRNIPAGYFDRFKIQEETSRMSNKSDDNSSRSKKLRKSRKSLAREKLEQTFKEKGFLIQTQQLESAEGATYCKFRQLRKFTRYLFRSWKDYLPGNVRNLSVDAGVENPEMLLAVPESAIKIENLETDGSEKFK